MMSRRRPKSFERWAVGVLGAVVTALIVYQLRIQRMEHIFDRDLSRIEHRLQPHSGPQMPATRSLSPEEIAALQESIRKQAEVDQQRAADNAKAAEEQQRKDESWSRYFTPTQRCQAPESRGMVAVCEANESKLRAKFEADWAAGKRA